MTIKKSRELIKEPINKEEPKTSLFSSIKPNKNVKKSKTDYGLLTVKALRRLK